MIKTAILLTLLLVSGYNLVALNLHEQDLGTDRNISLVEGWNLIGYSSDTALDLSNTKFINNSGSSFTFANAIANNKVQGYLAYLDVNAQANLSRYKYLSSVSGMDATAFEQGRGYWVYANQAGNLTLPSVGGSLAGGSYAYSSLRLSNGTSEKTIAEAVNSGWIESAIQYHDIEAKDYRYICSCLKEERGCSTLCLATSLNAWQGYFIKSNLDNLTLIRQN